MITERRIFSKKGCHGLFESLKNRLLGREPLKKKATKELASINKKKQEFNGLSDEAFLQKIKKTRDEARASSKEGRSEARTSTFACVREASKRILGMFPYDVQMLGGLHLDYGHISEMQTGEGKTLVAVAPAVFNAYRGRKVHIVTVNDYLAERDCEQLRPLYQFLGLSVGLITSASSQEERIENYKCDILYTTDHELGFDYLRDNRAKIQEPTVQQGLDYAIVDEVDSVLIDEARTPLIIAKSAEADTKPFHDMYEAVKDFKEGVDYKFDEHDKKLVFPLDEGISKAERALHIDELFSEDHSYLANVFDQMLKACFIMERDKDYIVRDGEVLLVDAFTGRVLPGRRFSDGLHQAIEAKEGVKPKEETKTVATITLQNFFRLYKKLAGMTGTAATEAEEFQSIYNLPVAVIPTNKPSARIDMKDYVFRTKEAKHKAVLEKVEYCQKSGQPILVGTTSVNESEELSSLLKKHGIRHNVLNAKNDVKEAEIISHAGELGAVTIATNMAGRGTDIKTPPEVDKVGGLFVLGTDKHESRRIDNQLRGRTARQGHPGATQFYISIEDELFHLYGNGKLSETFKSFDESWGDAPLQSEMLSSRLEQCQKDIEKQHFDTRRNVLRYDDVMNVQRTIIYKQRNDIRHAKLDDILEILYGFIRESVTEDYMNVYLPPESYPEEWDLEGFVEKVTRTYRFPGILTMEDIEGMNRQEIEEFLFSRFDEVIKYKRSVIPPDIFSGLLKQIFLQVLDEQWEENINQISLLRQGIFLQAYGQQDPLVEFKKEAHEMFEEMMTRIKKRYAYICISFWIEVQE